MAPFAIREKFNQGGFSGGLWITLPSTGIAKIFCSTPGVDWVCVDAEHGLISDVHYFDMCNAIASTGKSPIIRIVWDDIWMFKRALDAGAHGVIVPWVNTAEQARKIVSFCKYPPEGTRGFGPLYTYAAGSTGQAYGKTANQQVVIMAQIESKQAVDNTQAILEAGVDVALIGPFDLAVDLGVAPFSVEHENAIQEVLDASKRAGKKAGIICLDGESSKKRIQQGFHVVSITTDLGCLAGGSASAVATALKGISNS